MLLFTRKNKTKYLSMVVIVKDEDEYINEFIEYYKLLGVDHFYFYDNESAIPLTESLKQHRKYVTIHKVAGKAKQMDSYRHYIATHGKDSRWAAFFDLDEFVLPKTKYKLSDFLVAYEYADAIGINWMIFGDNNHEVKPAGLVTENYTKREINQNPHIKSIINPQKALGPDNNPHFFAMKEGATYVDARHNPLINAFNTNPSVDIIQINHYYTKSVQEFVKKAQRGRADSGEQRDVKTEFEPHRIAWNAVTDTNLVDKYLADLKKAMGL